MTSQQVLLSVAALSMAAASGCSLLGPKPPAADPLLSPYRTRQVWAVAPFRNESGSLQPDGAGIADQFQRHLENASNLDVVPVNRVIEAMNALRLPAVATPQQASLLRKTLGVDGLVVGTVTSWDSYDPPKIGLAMELYLSPAPQQSRPPDVRQLETAATDTQASLGGTEADSAAPASVVSAVMDAGDPYVRAELQRYAQDRGSIPDPEAWRRYRLSMDLFSEFTSYVMSWRLLDAERRRLTPPPAKPAVRQPPPQASR